MSKHWIKRIIIGLSLVALLAIFRSFVIVDQTESVYVTEFGRPVRLIERAGLHFKWPYQSARAFDRRLQLDTPPAREMLTRDKKNLEIAWYVSWRIADVERFLRTVRTVPDASARLEDMAASVLAAELGVHDLGGLVNVGNRSLLDTMMSALTERVGEQAAREYGLEVVAVRLRRLNYPEEVRSAVFEQIRSERQRVAAATRAEGESQARVIRSAADRERAAVIAAAESDSARMIGEGEAQAARIANEAHAADPAFYQFLKTLETYRAALDAKTTLVLSADNSFLRLLTQGVPDPAGQKPSNSTSSPSEPVAAAAHTESGTALKAVNAAHGHDARGSTSAKEGQKP
ncbi:MAG: protease modulator HflC [Isosphaerales bacterium]